jgi:hypothetical protein
LLLLLRHWSPCVQSAFGVWSARTILSLCRSWMDAATEIGRGRKILYLKAGDTLATKRNDAVLCSPCPPVLSPMPGIVSFTIPFALLGLDALVQLSKPPFSNGTRCSSQLVLVCCHSFASKNIYIWVEVRQTMHVPRPSQVNPS